ncbi:SnoaL-like domain-containing protein [Bosea sp. CRIB-10]|uniref:nuclear transport factor 2 family protein n=1 Tax=Bosea sp. CRIB-10 TaxID=378404 RepID=UPI0008F29029|nr:nuclear transport factor 2 family protein [Bosea sp. CRIB-10]SFD24440.1 SnoaL-like domain-containing protein [Bosea sp. CRIB-10]
MSSEAILSPALAAECHDGPKALALRYLAAMEQRDLDAARSLVSEDAVFVFPGGARRSDVSAIVAGSSGRYRSIAKHIERCDLCQRADGTVVVYVLGSLYGQWPDGSAFSGIRFVDRFEIAGGLIARQEVWNDSGEIRLAMQAGRP